MGKLWLLYKVTGSGICHTNSSSTSTTNTKSIRNSSKRGRRHTYMPSSCSSSCSSGSCMSNIFHLFHQPSFFSQTFINTHQEPNIIRLKGIEAPRNSLELKEQEPMVKEVASSSSKLNQGTNFNIPMGGIQIKTKISTLTEDVSSECSSSPSSTKTPNLVARLMGLDLLPQYSSPRSSLTSLSSSSHANPLINPISKLSYYKHNARSLPATPRVSTAARHSMEIDHHHRLSLQIVDESTNEYAKKIAKQVRENISRRVGVDITNTVKKREQRRDEHLVVLKPKRSSPPLTAKNTGKSRNVDQGYRRGKENEPIPVSCSPRRRFLNNLNNKPNSNSPKCTPLSSSFEVTKASSSATTKPQSIPLMKAQKCKRIASEKYDLRLKKVHRQEEPFVKKCNKKSTPLSNHLANVNTPTKFISLKKDMVSTSSTRLPQKQRILGLRSWVAGANAFEEEVEEMATEIERDVVDTLVDEMAGIIWHVGCESRV